MEIVTAIVSKVGEYLVEPTRNQARYIFRFNTIVEDLTKAERNLKSKQRDVEEEIKAAERNDEKIKATVQDWLSDSGKIMEEVETLKGKIEVNKTCLNGWCPNWGSRHQLGRKATKTSIQLKEIIDRGQFERVGCRALLSGEPSAPKDPAHLSGEPSAPKDPAPLSGEPSAPKDPAPLSGEPSSPKDFEFCRSTKAAFDGIMEALKNDGTHIVILYGMGGVGKTTLAREVRKTVKEKGIFKEVVMAIVSQTPNFRSIQGQLADFLDLKLTEETEEGRAQRLSSRLSKSNNSLVILDDVWEEFNFEEKIGVPLSKGCKMLLTTRNKKIYAHREYQSLIPLNVLEKHEGVALLKRQAGIDDDCDNLNTLATRIANECDGLPLAIVTTGRHLSGEKNIEMWEFVCEKLKKSKLEDLCHVNSEQRGVYASLKLSYDYLKTDEIKFCFLMCSLFPEDFEIPLEDLVRIGVGLDLYKDVSSIEEARRALRSMVETLKDLGLLLDAYGKEFVRMHDIVRDVCLWITSKGENIFMSKIGIDLTQLTREKGWKQYTAISLLENKLKALSVRLVCPKLKLLLLGGENQRSQLKVSDECFEEMKALEVVSLRYADLSLKSLQFLTNLKTLELCYCNLRDICSLAKLKKLEILSFRGSRFDELPIELSELKELRMLDLRECYQLKKISSDLRGCYRLKRIHSNLIRSLSQLEELYMEDIFEEWEAEEKSIETGNARLSEVNYLPCLAVLYLKINSKCLPKDFAFSELSRYEICVNRSSYGYSESSKALRIANIDATLLTALFKALYHSVEHLNLEQVTGCQNILPSIDQKGLKKLNTLEVIRCKDLKCMMDVSQVGEENPKLHPSLANLYLEGLPELQCIWKGPMSIHIVNFQSLTDVNVG
ncbi:disease resistance protein At4g27190-like isoform X2 [Pistacia vera]|nr:disease resistance protein At4g27190-like isoform X2 [Pistacia vera]